MVLSLDLSLACTGWALFNNGKLTDKGSIIPEASISNAFKVREIVSRLEALNLFDSANTLVIEDVYFGVNPMSIKELLRLSGAVIDTWVAYKRRSPILIMASHARKVLGIKGHAHKAEIQLYILAKYNFTSLENIKAYSKAHLELEELELPKGKYKYQLDKLSRKIEEETGIGEDIADAITLGLSYIREQEGQVDLTKCKSIPKIKKVSKRERKK